MSRESTAVGFGRKGKTSTEDPSKGNWTPYKIKVLEYLMENGIKFSWAKVKNATDDKAEEYMLSLDNSDHYDEKEYQYKSEGRTKKSPVKEWFVNKGEYVTEVKPYLDEVIKIANRFLTDLDSAKRTTTVLLITSAEDNPTRLRDNKNYDDSNGFFDFPNKPWGLHKNESKMYGTKLSKKLKTKKETDDYLWDLNTEIKSRCMET